MTPPPEASGVQPAVEPGTIRKVTAFENTFITDARGHGAACVFQDYKVRAVITTLLQERLKGTEYDPVTSPKAAVALAAELRDRVRGLGYSRHKLICQVSLSQQTGQAMRIASRCLWDPANDGSAWDHFENDSLVCVCQVYGLYLE